MPKRLSLSLDPKRVMLLAGAWLVGLVAVGFLGFGGQAGGATQAPASTVLSPVVSGSPVGKPGRELAGERTRTSRTYVTEDGRARMTRVFQTSVNYRDSSGGWRAIDNGLELSGGAYRNKANRFAARLPAQLGAGGQVSVSEAGGVLAFSLRDAVSTGRVNGSRITYPEAFAGVDLSYQTQADALKELITLKGATARRAFVFDLALSDGLRPSLEAGAVAIRDTGGALAMSVPAPFMTDADGTISHAVAFALDRVQSGWRLTLTAGDGWLDASDRAFPVDIDPMVFPGPQADCKLNQSLPTTDFCAVSHLEVGGAVGGERRTALRFDVNAAVPDGSTVTHSSLGLMVTGQTVATQAKLVNAHRLTRQIAAGATWNSPWTTAGGDFAAAVACEFCATVGGPSGGGGAQPGTRAYWNIRPLVEGWADGSIVNDGLLLKVDAITAEGNALTFASSEVSGSEPFLDIRYEQRSGVLPGHKYESQPLTDRLSLSVNSASGNLLLRARDLTVPGGLGPDLTVSRSYNSKHRGQAMGYGDAWGADSGPDVWIESTYQNDAIYHGPSGFDAFFIRSGTSSYTSPKGFNAVLAKVTGGGWTYTENQSQRKLTFDSSGRLTRDQDRNNRALTFTYSGSARVLQKITDSQGRDSTFTYASGRITQMTDSAGRLHKYFYNAGGELEKSTDPEGGDTLYWHDSTGLRLITTPHGRKTKITYHPAGPYEGRVSSITRVTNPTAAFASMTGPTTAFAYTQAQDGSGTSVVTDPEANVVTTVFNKDSRPTQTTDGEGRVTATGYTTSSNVETFTVAGNTGTTPNSKLLYDTDSNVAGANTAVAATTDPATCTTSTCVTSSANYGEAAGVDAGVAGRQYLLTSTTNEQGKVKTLGYGVNGNPTTIGSQSGTITLNYDGSSPGKLVSVTDQRAKTTSYGYDGAGNLTTITPPMPLGTTVLTYMGSLSRIATVTDANANLRTLAYDNLDRVKKITYHDGTYVEFVYDKDGNLTARNDSVGATTSAYTYDELSRIKLETLPGVSNTNTYTYDANGNLKTLVDAGGTVTYDYDKANRNESVKHSADDITTVFADHDGSLGLGPKVTTTHPNGVTVVREADYAGRLTQIKATKGATILEHVTYEYNDATYGQGVLRVRAIDELALTTTRYQYDDLDRLTRARTYPKTATAPAESSSCAADPRLACYEYTIDATGNRSQRTVTGSRVPNSTTTYGLYNAANQLSTRTVGASVSTYNYDANGNQTTRTGASPRTLGYNLRDQTSNLAGTTIGYLGAGQDQPVTEGTTTDLQHNVLGLGRRTTAGSASYYTRAVDGTPLAQRTGTSREYYITDALGSIIRTTDTAGATQATYAYDPDGNTTSAGTSTNPLRYAGGYQAPAGLYHYGQRYYDPADARWTQPDPLDQPGDLRQANRYPYVGADPINLTDPSGLALRDFLDSVGRFLGNTGRSILTKVRSVGPPHLRLGLCLANGLFAGGTALGATGKVDAALIAFGGGCLKGAVIG